MAVDGGLALRMAWNAANARYYSPAERFTPSVAADWARVFRLLPCHLVDEIVARPGGRVSLWSVVHICWIRG